MPTRQVWMYIKKLDFNMIRPELQILNELGYTWNHPHEVVDIFEKEICKYTGAKYGIATDSCSSALFLTLKYINKPCKLTLPKNTYISVPNYVKLAGYDIEFRDIQWDGKYNLEPLQVWDCAGTFTSNMYQNKGFELLSFQFKKILPIGKGGMILTNDSTAYNSLIKLRYDGRDLSKTQFEDNIEESGYHMYMTPEDAARGILLLKSTNSVNKNSHNHTCYPDISKHKCFN